MNWKSANAGPWLHGAAIWLATDGYSITEYVYKRLLLSEEGTDFNLKLFLVGLAATALAVLLSAGRNRGAVPLTVGETDVIKGVQAAGGSAILTDAASVVKNNEPVLILRGRTAAIVTDPPTVSPPPTADRPYDGAADRR